MKTLNANSKSEKQSKNKDSVRSKKIAGIKSRPSDKDIREKANEIYLQRIDRGEHGTAHNDWIEAEKFLTSSDD
jgi:hypothetical protein